MEKEKMNNKKRREVEQMKKELENLQCYSNRTSQPDEAQFLESRSIDDFEKLLHVKNQRLIRQNKELGQLITEAKKVAAQARTIYNLFLNKILNN